MKYHLKTLLEFFPSIFIIDQILAYFRRIRNLKRKFE